MNTERLLTLAAEYDALLESIEHQRLRQLDEISKAFGSKSGPSHWQARDAVNARARQRAETANAEYRVAVTELADDWRTR